MWGLRVKHSVVRKIVLSPSYSLRKLFFHPPYTCPHLGFHRHRPHFLLSRNALVFQEWPEAELRIYSICVQMSTEKVMFSKTYLKVDVYRNRYFKILLMWELRPKVSFMVLILLLKSKHEITPLHLNK